MKKTVIFLFSIFCMLSTHAQKIVWEKKLENTRGGFYISLRSSSDSGYILVTKMLHNIHSVDPKIDMCLSKFDKNGELSWKKNYQGPYHVGFTDFITLKRDEFLLVADVQSKKSDLDVVIADSLDGMVMKLGKKEKVLWTKTYGGSKEDQIASILPTSDGGYIFAGTTKSSDGDVHSGNKGEHDIWVVKLSSKGKIQWEKTYGGSLEERGSVKVINTTDGYILGASTESSDGDVKLGNKGKIDIWIFKIDKSGNLIWEKTYGGSQYDWFTDFQPTKDGGYVVAGSTDSSDGDVHSLNKGRADGWILKLDDQGNIQWEKSFGGSITDFFDKIIALPDGSFVAAGQTLSSDGDIKDNPDNNYGYWLMRVDENGKLLNEKVYGLRYNSFYVTDLELCKDGGVILGGRLASTGGIIYNTGWILKVKY